MLTIYHLVERREKNTEKSTTNHQEIQQTSPKISGRSLLREAEGSVNYLSPSREAKEVQNKNWVERAIYRKEQDNLYFCQFLNIFLRIAKPGVVSIVLRKAIKIIKSSVCGCFTILAAFGNIH